MVTLNKQGYIHTDRWGITIVSADKLIRIDYVHGPGRAVFREQKKVIYDIMVI